MHVLLDRAWFKSFCTQRANKIALLIYARTMSSVSSTRKNLFFHRLFRSVRGAKTDAETEDRYYAMEEKILREHKYFTHKMWMFCGSAVLRLSYQIGKVTVREFSILRRRLFRVLRRAKDDVDVNARVEAFFRQVRKEHHHHHGDE